MKIARNPQNIHPPVAPYVHQIEVTGPQRWLTLSGQIGMIADGSIPEDAIAQLKIALENIKRNLDSADMEVQDITKLVFYLVGIWMLFNVRKLSVTSWGTSSMHNINVCRCTRYASFKG